ncbi:MAG: ABC transporter permease [Catenulisporales bacterium]|nr:ABC transporter permease [Catenulisporales bacterium]
MSPHAFADTMTMARRDFKHTARYPMLLVSTVVAPGFLLVMFVAIFGGAMKAALVGTGTAHYVDYITPAILIQTVAFSAQSTAITVNVDMTEGVIARFRTMAIARTSVLTGTVVGSIARTVIAIALLFAVAVGLGYRTHGTVLGWLAALALIGLLTLGFMWLSVGFGLNAKTVAGASSSVVALEFLPFISGAFVPTGSMPTAVRWVSENQPFNPIIDSVRGLLGGSPVGHQGWVALAWCAGFAVLGYVWARRLYDREPVR